MKKILITGATGFVGSHLIVLSWFKENKDFFKHDIYHV